MIDADLRGALGAAVRGDGPWLVVVSDPSKVGESRTHGGKGSELVAGSSVAGLATIAAGVLQHAREIPLAATTADELAELSARLPASEVAAIERHSLAAYLVAGRERDVVSPIPDL